MQYYPLTTVAANTNVWWDSAVTTIYPRVLHSQPATDWKRAAVKAEPDDEFSWLRRRVREVEELAFA